MTLQDDAPELHIPAWKKLGLKLKYAQGNIDSVPPNLSPQTPDNDKKRKRTSDDDASLLVRSFEREKQKKEKKKKTKTEVDALGSRVDDDVFTPDATSRVSLQEEDSTSLDASRRGGARKSVSFTPDTKTTDGDSVKQLYKNWINSQLASDPSFDPSALQIITPGVSQKAKKPKGPKKSKAPSQQTKESSSLPHQATLNYLDTYYTSPSSWKFSKSRQTHLLRNIFSPNFIPPSYDPALKAYLSGLQGEGAKTRLREMARKIRAEDFQVPEYWDLDEARARGIKEDYEREKRRHKDRLKSSLKANEEEEEKEGKEKEDPVTREELENKIAARRMADIVLWSIGDEPDPEVKPHTKDTEDKIATADNTSTNPPLNGRKFRKRKHKLRATDLSDDESIGSSSSSSSNSNSSNASKDNLGGNTNCAKRNIVQRPKTTNTKEPKNGSGLAKRVKT
jgi:hypothetical protein